MNNDGGVVAQRGFRFQSSSLLFYYLLRKIDSPDLELILEPKEGEDGKIYSCSYDNGNKKNIKEFIQCKKKESGNGGSVYPGEGPGDEWQTGTFQPADLKKWIRGVADILESESDAYFTVLIFGEIHSELKEFLPENIASPGNPAQYVARFFLPDYIHTHKFLSLSDKFSNITEKVRRKIRIVPLDSPPGIELWCRHLLEEPPYRVSKDRSADILDKFRIRIADITTANVEELRRLKAAEVDAIIASGRNPQGKWVDAQKNLDKNNGLSQLPGWQIDFERGMYAHTKVFDDVWRHLENEGFVVLSGLPGSGKTTVCQYAAYQYLKKAKTNRAYYLNARYLTSFEEETRFFNENNFNEVLFIIDNEHFASTEINLLAQEYSGLRLRGSHKARLLITSTVNYTRTQELSTGANELNKATCFRMESNSRSLNNILNILINKGMLPRSLPVEALLSSRHKNDSVIGTALMIAKCVDSLNTFPTLRALLETKDLYNLLRTWILVQIGKNEDLVFFEREIVPVFILGAHGLPVPSDYNSSVGQLFTAGFLVSDDSRVYFPSSSKLALLISENKKDRYLYVFKYYFDAYPEYFPNICEQLQKNKRAWDLKKLCEDNLDRIIELINNYDPPLINLDGVSKIFRALHLSDKEISNKLLKKITTEPAITNTTQAYGEALQKWANRESSQINSRLFINLLNDRNPTKASSVESLFRSLYRINPSLTRAITKSLLTQDSLASKYLIRMFTHDEYDCRLDAFATCIHAIAKCSMDLAVSLYKQVKKTAAFEKKIAQAEANITALSIWLRFCQYIKFVNRQDAYEKIEQYLSVERVVRAILAQPEFNSISFFLNNLKRLNPRLASNVAKVLWEDNKDAFVCILTRQNDLNAFVNNLYVLSRINKRIAVRAAQSVEDRLNDLIRQEGNYYKVGAAIESLRKNFTESIALSAAESMERDVILTNLKNDNRPELIGKFLYNLNVLSPEMAVEFQKRLSFKACLQKLVPFSLRDICYLIRGFLFAAENKLAREEILEALQENDLRKEIRYHWGRANLTEVAFFLTVLLETSSINPNVILQLITHDKNSFFDYILRKFQSETSVFHLVNGLYGLAKFDMHMSLAAFDICLKGIESKDIKFNNIVDTGCLLRISTAIEPLKAHRIVSYFELNKLISFLINEGNLGRAAILIQGLHECSYKYALEFLGDKRIQTTWSNFHEEEEPDNIIHYARSVSRVSQKKGGDYLKMILNNKKIIYEMLEFETNLQLIANWLRLLSHYSKDFADATYLDKISDILLTATKYDTRLWSLTEATEALIECDNKEMAIDFADMMLQQKKQLKRNRSLHNWIVLIHKAIRIENELGLQGFAENLFEDVEPEQISDMIMNDENLILSSYACYLLLNSDMFARFRIAAFSQKAEILKNAINEPDIFTRVISFIFLETKIVEINKIADRLECHLWQRGLILLLLRSIYPEEKLNQHLIRSLASAGKAKEEIREVIKHAGNLEFGLVRHLEAFLDDANQIRESDAFNRKEDESNGALRWLLSQSPGNVNFKEKPYYLWYILKNETLRTMALNWDNEVENSNDSIHYDKEHRRDLNVLLA